MNQAQWKYGKQKKLSFNQKVDLEKYVDKAITQAIEGPFNALESNKISEGYATVNVCAYLAEKLCKAWGKMEPQDFVEGSDYLKAVAMEKDRLRQEVINGEFDDDDARARLSYHKICLLLERIHEGKVRVEELEI